MSSARDRSIGRMRRRIRIEAAQIAADGAIAWGPVATVWAAVAHLALSETEDAGRPLGLQRVEITLRWRAGFTSANRVVCDGRILRLVAVGDPTGDRRYLVALAEEEPQ